MGTLIKRYQFAIFLLLAVLLSWLPWYMTGKGFLVFGPSIAGILVIALVRGKEGLQRITQEMLRWRVKPKWWGISLFVSAFILLISMGINTSFGGESSPLTFIRKEWYLLPVFFIITILGGPLGEEFGWRGFALPYLQKRLNPLFSSVLLGTIWGLWHLPLFFQEGTLHTQIGFKLLPLYILGEIGLSILITWIYNKTDKSLLVGAIILHNADNFWSSILITDETLTTVSQQESQSVFNLQLYVISIFVGLLLALIVAWRTKGRLGGKEDKSYNYN